MSVFSYNPYDRNLYTEDELKKIILKFFNSNSIGINVQSIDYFGNPNPIQNIEFKKITIWFLEQHNIPIFLIDLKKLSIYELIELFLNMENNWESTCSSLTENIFIGQEVCIKWISHWGGKTISNLIDFFLKKQNVLINRLNNRIELDFSNIQFLSSIDKDINIIINDYIKIKNKIDEPTVSRKKALLSGLKSKLDWYFSNKTKSNIKESKFIKFYNEELRKYWQSLGSHEGKKSYSNEFEKIKTNFEKFELKKKHELLDDIFDSIMFLNYKKIF